MTYTSAKAKNEAIDILRNYSGDNPYFFMLQKVVIHKGDASVLNAFNVESVALITSWLFSAISKILERIETGLLFVITS